MPAPTMAAGSTKYHHHDYEHLYYAEANDCHHRLLPMPADHGEKFAHENGVQWGDVLVVVVIAAALAIMSMLLRRRHLLRAVALSSHGSCIHHRGHQ